jgi:hypothetical protein
MIVAYISIIMLSIKKCRGASQSGETDAKIETKTNAKTNPPINNNKSEEAFPIVNPELKEASNE